MNPLFKERRGKSDMPYIRTENFIHDSKDVVIVNENGTLVVLRGIDKDFVERTHGKTWNTGTNVVLAQADTIEELCDEFVCQENDYFYWLASRENVSFRDLPNCYCKAIFGAIWTDKGLIFVAKMNKDGKLELL